MNDDDRERKRDRDRELSGRIAGICFVLAAGLVLVQELVRCVLAP